MNFQIPPHIQDLMRQMREFVYEELIPLENSRLYGGHFGELLPILQEKRAMVKAQGWWAPWLHHEWGGMGLSLTEYAHISEVLAHSPLGHYVFNCQAPDVGNMEVLMMFGNEAQQDAYLRPLASGDIRSCFSMTEPERAGSNPTWLDTTAVRDGDEYVINGRKWFTSSADGAAFAIVMAVTNPEAEKHGRASMILVPTDTPGFNHLRKIQIMGDEGSDHASHSEVEYVDCRVPAENIIHHEGAGFMIAQARLGPGRIHHAMRWIGIAERALDLMCQYAVRREVAPGRPLAGQQTIQNWVAESRAEIEAARLMVLRCAHRIDELGAKTARVDISMIKFFVAPILQKVLDRAIQAHGALGMTDDTPLSYWFRHERAARIYDGPDEVHKMVVAREEFRKWQ